MTFDEYLQTIPAWTHEAGEYEEIFTRADMRRCWKASHDAALTSAYHAWSEWNEQPSTDT